MNKFGKLNFLNNIFPDNKVDNIDRKSTDRLSIEKLQQSSYDTRKKEKKDRIERIDEEVMDLRKDVSEMTNQVSVMTNQFSEMLFLLKKLNQVQQESVQKTEITKDSWTIEI